MDGNSYYLAGIVVAGLLAIANVWRGTLLLKQGESGRGRKHVLLGAAMIMFMVMLLLFKQG